MRDNIYQYPDPRVVEDEAAHWIARLDSDMPPTPEELELLKEWLERSPAHRQALADMVRFWNTNVLTELSVPLPRAIPNLPAVSPPARRWPAIGLAAALVLVVAMALWIPGLALRDGNGLYVTAVGEHKTVTLADGSTVKLNTNSQIDVRYAGKYRNVQLLQGEAFFTVAKDPARPFRVYAQNSRIQAVGTSFTVYAKGADIDVSVLEGKVLLEELEVPKVSAAGKGPTKTTHNIYASPAARKLGLLSAGQKATVLTANAAQTKLAKIETVDPETIEESLSWSEGMLAFSGEPLHEVVESLSRYTTMTIEIADPSIRDIQIGGQLRVDNIEATLASLESNFGLKVTWQGYNHVRLSAADND